MTIENDEYAEAVRELAQTEFLTVAQVADKLNCGRPTVYKLVANRQLGAVRLGTGSNPPIRVPEVELDRYVKASRVGGDLHARAEKILALQGIDPADATAEEYTEALRDAGDYSSEVFVDRLAHLIHEDVEEAHRAAGHRAVGSHQRAGSDVVDVEKIMLEELARLGDPLPVAVALLGAKGLGREALNILGSDPYSEADYRRAVRQAIREAVNPKRGAQ